MTEICADKIPSCLKALKSWVVWKEIERDGKLTKVPFQVGGEPAKSNDPSTWNGFELVCKRQKVGYSGIGFMFAESDPFCGVDLDGCRNPETDEVSGWAKEIILALDSYAEVSPSKTGVKIFVRGKWNGGRKTPVIAHKVCEKEPAIEIYDRLRYFAVTGWRLQGPHDPQERQAQLDWLKGKFWPDAPSVGSQVGFYDEAAVIERARKYLAKMPPAISGSNGHGTTFKTACRIMHGFGLSPETTLSLLREWNATCNPPWSEKELQHKVNDAAKQSGERNYLRNMPPQKWESVKVPDYHPPVPKAEPRVTTLADAAKAYIQRIKDGRTNLLSMGIGDVDHALGGGIEAGEIVVIAARSSHGKSAVALQCVHHWTADKMPCLIISEEMGRLALGKRTVQFVSDIPQEHWHHSANLLERDIVDYESERETCIIVESCGTAQAAVEQMEIHKERTGLQFAVVDYAQLLRSPGSSRYDRVTNTCEYLVAGAKRLGITLVMLCQLSREIERRPKFLPIMSDLKESGQFEQDADVILFLVWPHRLDSKLPPHEYKIFVAKNRNREILNPVVTCRFEPSRQRVRDEKPSDKKNYEPAFANREFAP